MVTTTNQKNKKNTLASVKRTTAGKSNVNYVFPRRDTVPEGDYSATIDSFGPSKTNYGSAAYDVCYTIKDKKGTVRRIRQRTAAESIYMEKLVDQLLAAGVDEDAELDEINGTKVKVTISYGDSDFATVEIHPVRDSRENLLSDDDDEDLDFDAFDEDHE